MIIGKCPQNRSPAPQNGELESLALHYRARSFPDVTGLKQVNLVSSVFCLKTLKYYIVIVFPFLQPLEDRRPSLHLLLRLVLPLS